MKKFGDFEYYSKIEVVVGVEAWEFEKSSFIATPFCKNYVVFIGNALTSHHISMWNLTMKFLDQTIKHFMYSSVTYGNIWFIIFHKKKNILTYDLNE